MLKIRLSRVGKKKQPQYRIVVNEHSKDTYSDYLEKVGYFDPKLKTFELNEERVKYWISKGAQLSDTLHNLLIEKGIIEGKKSKPVNISKKRATKLGEKAAKEKEQKEAEAAKAEEAKKAAEEPKVEEPKAEEEPKVEEPKAEEAPAEEPKAEETPAEEPKAEETPAEEPKTEEPKAE